MSERQNAGIHTLANKGAETWKKKKKTNTRKTPTSSRWSGKTGKEAANEAEVIEKQFPTFLPSLS